MKRILLFDGDAEVRDLVARTFRPPDFEVHAFSDGRDALSKLQTIRPDVIVCDVAVPDMDARLFVQVAKRSPRLRRVPFVFLTAVTTRATIEATLAAGAAAFLVKPFSPALLRKKLIRTLSSERAAVPPTARRGSGRAAAPRTPTHVILEDVRTVPLKGPTKLVDVSLDGAFAMLSGENGSGAVKAPRAPISGRFSTLETEDGSVLVLTEVTGSPAFSITTVIARAGRLRKIETTWAHPLQRQGDAELALHQIDVQHEHALDLARERRAERTRAAS